MKKPKRKAFSLIELLTVIAIIGILAAILIPVSDQMRQSARRTQSKAQFSQYAQALKLYKNQYGYWPPFGTDAGGVRGVELSDQGQLEDFAVAVTGRNFDGDPDTSINPRGMGFYSFSNEELVEEGGSQRLQDAFNNENIFIAMDLDGDGKIPVSAMPGGAVQAALQEADIETSSGNLNATIAVYSLSPDEKIFQIQ